MAEGWKGKPPEGAGLGVGGNGVAGGCGVPGAPKGAGGAAAGKRRGEPETAVGGDLSPSPRTVESPPFQLVRILQMLQFIMLLPDHQEISESRLTRQKGCYFTEKCFGSQGNPS